MPQNLKEVIWIGSSKKDLSGFPGSVKKMFGVAIFYAQKGSKHPSATPMKGFKGAGVLEIIEDSDTDTYRCVYTVKLGKKIYILHAFKKKSKKGIATPRADIGLIASRLVDAKELEGIK